MVPYLHNFTSIIANYTEDVGEGVVFIGSKIKDN